MSDDEDYDEEQSFQDVKREKIRHFIPFHKVVEQIGDDSDKFSRKYRLNRDENGTYFTEALIKWNDADQGCEFVAFSNELPSNELDTYAQLLYHSKTIVSCLFRHMKVENTKSSPAFCEILTALSKDLREDFKDYIWEAIDAVSFVLDDGLQDKDTVEAGFFALTSLIKVMSKTLVKSMKKTFGRLVPLLGSSRSYVRRFVAQAFAFLLRRAQGIVEYTQFMIEQADKIGEPRLSNGISMLLFQTYRGISGGFQSSLPEVLRDIVLGVFKTVDSVRERGLNILQETLNLTVSYVKEKSSDLNPVQNVFYTLLEANKSSVETSDLLSLFATLIVKNGFVSLSDVGRLNNLLQYLVRADHFTFNDHSINALHLALTVALENSKWMSSCKDIFQVVIERFQEKQDSEVFRFLHLCQNISVFDLSVLPSLSLLAEPALRDGKIEVLHRIISLFSSMCGQRRPLLSYTPGSRKPFFDVGTQKVLRSYVISTLPNLAKYDLEKAVFIVHVWPWLFSELQEVEGVSHVVNFLEHILSLEKSSEKVSQAALIVGSSLYLVGKKTLCKLALKKVEEFVKQQDARSSASSLYLLYIKSSDRTYTVDDLERVANLFMPVLLNANSKQRLTVLEILSYFEENLSHNDISKNFEGAFTILKQAENVELLNYRERLRLFRLITFGHHKNHIIPEISSIYEEIILRIGYAQFFVSFTLLWPAMHELLSSMAHGMSFEKFWAITEDVFLTVTEGCRSHKKQVSMETCFEDIVSGVDLQSRKDYLSVRIQLLKFFVKIPQLIQRKTRVLSPLFIDIFENDYLTAHQASPDLDDEDDAETEKSVLDFKDVSKVLCAFMELYGKFNDAKSVYRESEIRKIYLEILITGSEIMLPLAMNCLYAYKDKKILAYREYFDGLIVLKSFREKLTLLKISEDEGDAVLSPEHREAVMPVLLRILLGTLSRKGDKKYASTRRSTIFRYLMGCRHDELQIFIEICFRSLYEVVGGGSDMCEKMEKLCQDASLLDKIDLKRLITSLDNAGDLLKKSAQALTPEQKSFIYRVFLSLGVIVTNVLKSTELPPYKATHAKKLRKALANCIVVYFHTSCNQPVEQEQVQQLYDLVLSGSLQMEISPYSELEDTTLIVPALANVPILAVFSRYPRLLHFYTLKMKNEFNVEVTAFDVMISVLFRSATQPFFKELVRKSILDMLTYADEDGMIKRETDKIKLIGDVNYGSSIVLGSLERVLCFLSRSVQDDVEKKMINPINLEIINRVSDFVRGGKIAEKLAFTILDYLRIRIPREDICCKMLKTLGHLARGIVKCDDFLQGISRIYANVVGQNLRVALANICVELTTNPNIPKSSISLLQLCADLDSYDVKMIGEVDHDKRHAAFSKLYTMCENSEEIDLTMLKLIINLCHNTLFYTKELSLRSTSGTTIRKVFEYVVKADYEESKKMDLISQTMCALTLKGFASEQEIVRDECLRNLRTLVIFFPNHPQLNELTQLISEKPDEDFFMNLYHIQVHRRQKAIRNLSIKLTEEKSIVMGFSVLNNYIAPIIAPYLVKTSEDGETNTNVALGLYKAIYTLAPWKSYWPVFRMWLGRTERLDDERRAYVRVLCTIIEAFHFDVADTHDVLKDDGSNEEAILLRSLMNAEIIPRLQICINGRGTSDAVHKTARTGESIMKAEKDDVIRVPVALATVKLLLKLPKSYLDQYLHGIILKLSKLMIARSVVVRKHARETTLKVVSCLGPEYLAPIIKEIKMLMNKGYQVHVMVFTVYALIVAMQQRLTTGILDNCLDEIMDAVVQDQFGNLSEEKEIGSIRAKVYEAKGNTSPETMYHLGRFSSHSVLGIVIDKLQQTLENKCTRKAMSRAAHLLSKFANGLKVNEGVSIETQLILIHGILDSNVLRMEKVDESNKAVSATDSFRPQSCLLLPEAPRRMGAIAKTSVKSRVHVFVEFALQLLASLFKEKRLRDYSKPKLEPFVPLVLRCLALKYDLVISNGLDCLYHFFKYGLSSVNTSIERIIERLFVLLADYINLGDAANQPEMLLLNNLLFKTFTKIIFKGHENHFSRNHVELLLNYIETDIMDSNKQATAFSLIKAMISRKMKHARIPVVMRRISELAIIADLPFIRRHCRETVCQYVFEHPTCNKGEYLEFFSDQLDYEFSDGRKNAAEVLYTLFSELLPPSLEESYMYCLTKLGLRLVNETVPDVRKYISLTLRKLLEAITEPMRKDVVEVATEWLKQPKEAARAIGYSIFVELSHVEKAHFVAHLDTVVSNVLNILSSEDVMDMNSERSLTTLMEGLVMIINNIGEKQAKCFTNSDDFYRLIGLLEPIVKCFGSTDTRKSACGLIGLALSIWDSPFKLPKGDGIPTVKQLCDWMCWLIKDNLPNEDVSEQASKNIVFMASSLEMEDFQMIIDTLYKTCQFEIVNRPSEAVKRLTCFKIAAALIMKEGKCERTDFVIEKFFDLFVREISRKSKFQLASDVLFNLASEIAIVLKDLLSEHEYNQRFAQSQRNAIAKVAERKQKIKELAVTAPHEHAEHRRKLNRRQTERRKRKLDALKPHRIAKRKHAQERELRRDD